MTGPALTAILLAGCVLAQACAATLGHAAGSRGAVATGACEATEAALKTMQRGGKAVPEVRLELERRGHAVVETRSLSATQAVAAEPDAGGLVAVSDPRSGGRAGAW